jgi:hypothetical protein
MIVPLLEELPKAGVAAFSSQRLAISILSICTQELSNIYAMVVSSLVALSK